MCEMCIDIDVVIATMKQGRYIIYIIVYYV